MSQNGTAVAFSNLVLRPACCWLALACAAALPAQAPRLVDSLAAPLAYLSLDAGASATRGQPGAVQRLLADPALGVLLGPTRAAAGGAGGEAPVAPNGGMQALALVRGLMTRSVGELEIALTGVVPDRGQPLLVLRVRLQQRESQRLQQVLATGELAAPGRQFGAQQAYRLRSEEARDDLGHEVELALVGDDLLVGNDSLAFATLLQPASAPARTGPVATTGLAADPRYQALRTQANAGPGALHVYVDWPRLGRNLRSSLDGMPGALLRTSGLDAARSVLLTIDAPNGALAATLLLDVPRDHQGADPEPLATTLDGWFASVRPIAGKSLAGELPGAGLGGLVLSVDLAQMFTRTHGGEHLLHDLEHAYDDYGLDFQRNVVSRLGEHGTVQLHVARSSEAVAEVHSVYALRTKGRTAAVDLFADLRRVAETTGLGKLVAGRERRSFDLLELKGRGPEALSAFVAIGDDEILVASDADSVAAAVDERRSAGRSRARRDQLVTQVVQALGSDRVAGMFDIDLAPLFAQLAASFVGTDGKPLDLSRLPKRHVGCVDVHRDDTNSIVRIRVLSSR